MSLSTLRHKSTSSPDVSKLTKSKIQEVVLYKKLVGSTFRNVEVPETMTRNPELYKIENN